MADSNTATSVLLYSQTEHDERGNFSYDGDLHRSGEGLAALARRIQLHLHDFMPGAVFAVLTEAFAGGRKINVELLDHPVDLTDQTERQELLRRFHDQIERFNIVRSNYYQDYLSCSFYSDVRVARAYWVALAARRGAAANSVAPIVPLAAFKRRVKPGDVLLLIHSSLGTHNVGVARKVVAARSADLVLEGPSYLSYPRAAAFSCDGKTVRVAIGNEHDPDAHLLYEWLPAAD